MNQLLDDVVIESAAMAEIRLACNWAIHREHLRQHSLPNLIRVTTAFDCDICIDWEPEVMKVLTRPLILRAPSLEHLRPVLAIAETTMEMTNWHEITQEYFDKVTRNGIVPSVQEMDRKYDDQYSLSR